MKLEVSVGEAIDKYTILCIKYETIKDDKKLINIIKEKNEIACVLSENNYLIPYENEIKKLKKINQKLWNIEDKIREKEAKKEFDYEFIELARSVYITNDERFELKKQINQKTNSNFKEEKSYVKYD